jgi:methyltransferase (TIGR00027 family)
MTKRGVEQEPSETALFGALHRAIAHKEFEGKRPGPDYLAEHFLPPHYRFFIKFKRVRTRTRRRFGEALPGLHEYVMARTAYFDGVFVDALKSGVPQIVLLGAGYDSRAIRFAALNRATRIVELDIATTQARKKSCLAKARIDVPVRVSFVPIDFHADSLDDVLARAGCEQDEKTLYLWEGVSYYLEPEAVDATLGFVGRSSHPESAIAFDYAVSISEDTIDDYYGVRTFAQSMRTHHPQELFRFTIDEGNIGSFLEQRGLRLVQHLDNQEMEQTFLVDDHGSLPGPVTGLFRFVLASPDGRKQEPQ